MRNRRNEEHTIRPVIPWATETPRRFDVSSSAVTSNSSAGDPAGTPQTVRVLRLGFNLRSSDGPAV